MCFEKEKDINRMNLKWVQFSYHGIQHVAQIAWKQIKAGTELLTDYGDGYCYETFEELKRNTFFCSYKNRSFVFFVALPWGDK